jgi:hypothetical protein
VLVRREVSVVEAVAGGVDIMNRKRATLRVEVPGLDNLPGDAVRIL